MAGLEFTQVHILWADAHAGPDQWTDADELDEAGEYIVGSVGWLIPSGAGGKEGHVTLAQSITQDGHVDHVIYIPVGMVKKVIALTPPAL